MRTTLTVRLPQPHASQAAVIAQARRFNVANCGRRYGKSTLGVDRIVIPALEGYPVAWFAPTYKMLTDMWRVLRSVLQPVTRIANDAEKRIELITGGTIDGWSLVDPDAARGRKYKRVIVDEAAMVKRLADAWNAVIRPTLADMLGDAWFLSTPKGVGADYHTFWLRGQDPNWPDWASWQLPTSANPYISPTEIEAARRETVELYFHQEYLAEFVTDGSGVFRRVLEQARAEAQEKPINGHVYAFGVDWGKHADFTVIQVIDATIREQVWMERFNRIDYAVQSDRLDTLYRTFKPEVIIAERNSMGEPIIEALMRRNLPITPFTTTNQSKAQAVEALALALERDDLRLLNDPVLVGELLAFQAERLPGGMLRYSAPSGQHDDCVMALALAWQALADSTPTDEIMIYDEPYAISPY